MLSWFLLWLICSCVLLYLFCCFVVICLSCHTLSMVLRLSVYRQGSFDCASLPVSASAIVASWSQPRMRTWAMKAKGNVISCCHCFLFVDACRRFLRHSRRHWWELSRARAILAENSKQARAQTNDDNATKRKHSNHCCVRLSTFHSVFAKKYKAVLLKEFRVSS